jgi:hypothetical protein
MNDMELTSVDVRAASESLFQNTPSRTLPEQVNTLKRTFSSFKVNFKIFLFNFRVIT